MVELKGLFRRNNYVQLIINAALGYVSYYCDCGIHAATCSPLTERKIRSFFVP